MKLLFLGASSAFCVGKNNFQSNMLIEAESGRKLLIDCGTDARHSLYAQGYTHSDIEAVYVSHLHADHAGGLEWFGFSKLFIDHQKPALYISSDQRNLLWDNLLSAGMSSLEEEQASLTTYFDVHPIEDNFFVWEGYKFELVKTIHVISNGKVQPSYGLVITVRDQTIFLSTDTRFDLNSLHECYNRADIIFHDCETKSTTKSGQHSHFNDLVKLDKTIRNKMWLYDYNEGDLPDAISHGFKGFVVAGQVFEFNEEKNK